MNGSGVSCKLPHCYLALPVRLCHSLVSLGIAPSVYYQQTRSNDLCFQGGWSHAVYFQGASFHVPVQVDLLFIPFSPALNRQSFNMIICPFPLTSNCRVVCRKLVLCLGNPHQRNGVGLLTDCSESPVIRTCGRGGTTDRNSSCKCYLTCNCHFVYFPISCNVSMS